MTLKEEIRENSRVFISKECTTYSSVDFEKTHVFLSRTKNGFFIKVKTLYSNEITLYFLNKDQKYITIQERKNLKKGVKIGK